MRWKILLILVFIPFILFSQEKIYEDNRGFFQEKDYKYNVKPGGKIVIVTRGGDVFIKTGNDNQLQIKTIKRVDVFSREDASRAFEMCEVLVEKRDNAVYVEDHHEEWNRRRRSTVSIDYNITVPKKFNYEFETSGGDVKFYDNIEGDVELRSSGGDFKAVNLTGNYRFATSGGDVEFRSLKGDIDCRTSGGNIEADEIDAEAYLHTSGGDLDIRKLSKGGKISSSGGDIEIRELKGRFDGESSGGDVTISDAKGELDVRTSGGDIDIDVIIGELRLSTSGGEPVIDRAAGYIDISSSGGDVSLEIIEIEKNVAEQLARSQRIRVKASGGEIVLYLPENIKADIDARIRLSSRYDSYDIDSDFPIVISKDARFKTGKGKINGGGIPIILETSNENIYIKRAR